MLEKGRFFLILTELGRKAKEAGVHKDKKKDLYSKRKWHIKVSSNIHLGTSRCGMTERLEQEVWL